MNDLAFVKIEGPGVHGDADDRRENVLKTTPRGFALIEFTDLYGEKCRLQKSSLGTQDAIWLGVSDPKLQVLVPGHGFQEMPLDMHSGKLSISSSMHLSRVMAARLLPYLKKFVETGELEAPSSDGEEGEEKESESPSPSTENGAEDGGKMPELRSPSTEDGGDVPESPLAVSEKTELEEEKGDSSAKKRKLKENSEK